MAVHFTAGDNLRENGSGNVESFKQFGAPVQGFEIHELRSAGVGDVSNVNAAVHGPGELPNEVAIDVAEGKFTSFGEFARAANVVE